MNMSMNFTKGGEQHDRLSTMPYCNPPRVLMRKKDVMSPWLFRWSIRVVNTQVVVFCILLLDFANFIIFTDHDLTTNMSIGTPGIDVATPVAAFGRLRVRRRVQMPTLFGIFKNCWDRRATKNENEAVPATSKLQDARTVCLLAAKEAEHARAKQNAEDHAQEQKQRELENEKQKRMNPRNPRNCSFFFPFPDEAAPAVSWLAVLKTRITEQNKINSELDSDCEDKRKKYEYAQALAQSSSPVPVLPSTSKGKRKGGNKKPEGMLVEQQAANVCQDEYTDQRGNERVGWKKAFWDAELLLAAGRGKIEALKLAQAQAELEELQEAQKKKELQEYSLWKEIEKYIGTIW